MVGFSSLRRLPGVARVLRALGISSVPAAGYFGAGWSIGTLLLLYWLETILVTLVVSVLILLHRGRSRRSGHWGVKTQTTYRSGGRSVTRSGSTTYLASFLAVMVPFTLAHGVFVLLFALVVFPDKMGPEAAVSVQSLVDGLIGIAAFLVASFVLDLPGLGQQPFGWVERLAGRAQGRMVVTHLTIIFGAGAMAMFGAPGAFMGVFVALKALLDLGGALPEKDPQAEAPRVTKTLDRWLPKREGKSFGQALREKIAADRAATKAKDRVLPPGG